MTRAPGHASTEEPVGIRGETTIRMEYDLAGRLKA